MPTCSRCHTCGLPLRTVFDGEEWCDACRTRRRYHSHGWVGASADAATATADAVRAAKFAACVAADAAAAEDAEADRDARSWQVLGGRP